MPKPNTDLEGIPPHPELRARMRERQDLMYKLSEVYGTLRDLAATMPIRFVPRLNAAQRTVTQVEAGVRTLCDRNAALEAELQRIDPHNALLVKWDGDPN